MTNYIPFEKLSKKEQKRLNAEKRGSWNGLNPTTRTTKDRTKYNRKEKHKVSYDC